MDEIRQILESHQKLVLAHANEAETRLKLIDKVIFSVLKWTEDDLRVEETVSEDGKTTYADYIISTGFTSFVIEAKKVGAAFLDVPSTRKHLLNRRLVTGTTGDAIVQAPWIAAGPCHRDIARRPELTAACRRPNAQQL